MEVEIVQPEDQLEGLRRSFGKNYLHKLYETYGVKKTNVFTKFTTAIFAGASILYLPTSQPLWLAGLPAVGISVPTNAGVHGSQEKGGLSTHETHSPTPTHGGGT